MLVEVENSKYMRDTNSMVLLNTDNRAREEYYSRGRITQYQKDEINTIKSNVSSMQSDILEIKSLLKQLLSKEING